jgi:hypothetical protein
MTLSHVHAARVLRRWRERPGITPGPEFVLDEYRVYVLREAGAAIRSLLDGTHANSREALERAIEALRALEPLRIDQRQEVPAESYVVDLAASLKKGGMR